MAWLHACFCICMLALAPAPAAASETAASPPRIELTGGFAAISTSDADRLSGWWQQHFGFEVLQSGGSPDGSVKFALLRRGEYFLEIVQRSAASAAPSIPDRSYQHGYFKVGFTVADIELAERQLRSAGVDFAHGIVQPAGNPYRTFAVRDPDGNVVQLFGK